MTDHPMPSTDLLRLLTGSLGLDPTECRGKTVLITGAGRGIGRETARCFGMLGAQVVIAEIDAETGCAAEALVRAEGGLAACIQTDVSRADSVQALFAAVLTRFGAVDVLVNNAIRCPVALVSEMALSTWDAVIGVNLRGAFLTCQAALPGMLARGSGVIVNMVSTDAMPGLSAYIASKQGITGFSLSLAQEVAGRGIQVIPFAPGMVDTPAIREIAGEISPLLGLTREGFLGMSLHPAYPGLMPAAHAGAATVYLALRLAAEVHGQAVDGYEVLERAGLLTSPAAPEPALSAQPPAAGADLQRSIARLALILAETGQEFERLPLFARPMARAGFKSKSGHSLGDWQHGLAALESQCERLPAGQAQEWTARLDKLAVYYRGVPAETARFTHDADLISQVTATCQERLTCIQQVKEGLSRGT